ncbi:MAG TPA: hypothetical protein VED40_07770 [Azospirillaceae bacterium]|nr:hypothetical protein [Azospirillaceae bacterium]
MGRKTFKLVPHTAETRVALKRDCLFYRHVPDQRLTHYVDVDSSAQSVALGCVRETVTLTVGSTSYQINPMYIENLVIPSESVRLAAASSAHPPAEEARRHLRARLGVHGLGAVEIPDSLDKEGLAALLTASISYADAQSTAVALLFHHVALMHLNGTTQYPAYIYASVLNSGTVAAAGMSDVAYTIHKLGDGWRTPTASVDAAGNAILDPVTNQLMYRLVWNPGLVTAMAKPLNAAIALARNDATLENQLWNQPYGTANASYGAVAAVGAPARPPRTGGTGWQLTNVSAYSGFSADKVSYENGQLSLTVTNNYLRHLSAYIQFSDATNTPITLDDAYLSTNGMQKAVGLPDGLRCIDGGDAQIKRWVQAIPPVGTICGVPISGDPVTITVPVPDTVAYVNFFFGAAAFSGAVDHDVTPSGAALTCLYELLLPPILLGLGDAIEQSSIIKSLTSDASFMQTLFYALAPGVATGALAYLITDPIGFLEHFGEKLATLMMKALSAWLVKTGGTAAAAGEVIGVAAQWLGTAIVGMDLGITTYDISQSVPVYKVGLTNTVDLDVTISPDPSTHLFPPSATGYTVLVSYDGEATSPVATIRGNIPTTRSTPIVVSFTGVPAAGKATVTAVFHASNGWVAGQGSSAPLTMSRTSGTITTALTITDNPVPISGDTRWTHKEITTCAGGTYAWKATAAPPTVLVTDGDDPVRTLGALSLCSPAAAIAYSWQGTDITLPLNRAGGAVNNGIPAYLVQTLSIAEKPGAGLANPGVCYTAAPAPGLMMLPAAGAVSGFFLDPSGGAYDPMRPGSGYQLRGFPIVFNEPPDLAAALSTSWGTFLTPIDRIAIHPQGRAFGLSAGLSSLQMIMLPSAGSSTSPVTATLICGPGTREGLLTNPVALAIAPTAALYVLEAGDGTSNAPARVQAFDLSGNPTRIFGAASSQLSYFPLREQTQLATYLEIAVDTQGYVFVLYYLADGSALSDYVLDVYPPAGGAVLTSTTGIAAASFAVAITRDIYTLNYQSMTGAAGWPEPTVSHWIPTPP